MLPRHVDAAWGTTRKPTICTMSVFVYVLNLLYCLDEQHKWDTYFTCIGSNVSIKSCVVFQNVLLARRTNFKMNIVYIIISTYSKLFM